MLDKIGESAVRMTARTDSNLTVGNKDIALQEVEKAVAERPIEESQEITKPDTEEEKRSGSYDMDDGGVYFEKYDNKGNVIYRVPPEQKPIDEIV